MLIDDITLLVEAGSGGRGGVYFGKGQLSKSPAGGDGGKGADVYFEGVADINALAAYTGSSDVHADNGKDGGANFRDGRGADDRILKIPVGTVVINIETGETREVPRVGDRLVAALGGKGGQGNFTLRVAPGTKRNQFVKGAAGEVVTYQLQLRLIADVGLIGLPNAGKSSLLNELTRAKSKVANYAFTTLEPNLGAYYELIIADIPGLIEGASGGKGLGVKFLKHIERTKTLFHLVSAESDDVVRDYRIVRTELQKHNPALEEKEEYVFISKSDMVSPKEITAASAALKKIGVPAMPFSVLDAQSLTYIRTILNTIKDRPRPVEPESSDTW